MGIYDRDYVFSKPGRLGQPRLFSINTWIIIINCIVFFGGFMLKGLSVPVYRDARVTDTTITAATRIEPAGPYLTLDGQMAPDKLRHTPGTALARQLIRSDTKATVDGLALYVVDYPFQAYGHFSTHALFKGEIWRPVTFQFLHASITHLLFNMLGLYMFGGMVEQYLGPKRFLAFYLVCGVAGSLTYLILNVLGFVASEFFSLTKIPGLLYSTATTPLVGASAGVFGVILACAYISPNSIVQLLFPPIPMKLRTMAYVYVGIAVATVLFGGQNAGGEAAHIGGAIAGFFLIRNSHLLLDFFDVFTDSRKPKPARRPFAPQSVPDAPPPPPRRAPDDVEVDRILAKVSAEGIQSLTSKEREALRRASETRRASGGT